jgi:hypothetical protein
MESPAKGIWKRSLPRPPASEEDPFPISVVEDPARDAAIKVAGPDPASRTLLFPPPGTRVVPEISVLPAEPRRVLKFPARIPESLIGTV